MIKRAEIQGYKCLRDVKVDLAPFTVLIGPNDSGKSSFLQALALPWHLSSFSRAQGYRIALFGETATATAERSEDAPARSFTSRGGPVDGRLIDELASFSPNGPAPVIPPDLLALRATRPLVLDASKTYALAHRSATSIDHLIRHQGGGVAARMSTLALSDRKNFEAVQRSLTDITDGRVSECIVLDMDNSNYSLAFRLHDGVVIPAEDLSAGLLMYLAFLVILHRNDAPGVLLVEEPENGLHPLRIAEVVKILRKLTERGTQVICTTHSPDLLSSCEPSEVRVFLRPERDAGTLVHELSKNFDRIAMRSTLGEIWASRGEEGLLDILPNVQPTVRVEAS